MEWSLDHISPCTEVLQCCSGTTFIKQKQFSVHRIHVSSFLSTAAFLAAAACGCSLRCNLGQDRLWLAAWLCNLVFPQRALLVSDLIYVQTATQPIIKSIVAENDNARTPASCLNGGLPGCLSVSPSLKDKNTLRYERETRLASNCLKRDECPFLMIFGVELN